MIHYYCAIFHFARGSRQWKMYWCCLCDHCCSPVLERRGMTARTRNGINEVQNTREFYHSLKYEFAARLYFFASRFSVISWCTRDSLSLQSLKQIIIRDKLSLPSVLIPSAKLAAGNTLSRPENSFFWASLLLSRQTVNGCILRNTVQELFNIFDIAR